jgi:hypothetical protein
MKSDAERGPVGAWLRRERMGRKWSVDRVVQELTDGGYPVSAVYYRQVEAGRKAGPALVSAAVRLFGSEPDDQARRPETAREAIVRLADSVESLTALLATWLVQQRPRE